MRFEKTDLAVGVVVLGAVAMVAGVGLWLASALSSPSYSINTHFTRVDGIATQVPVYLRGYQIGQVESIEPRTLADGSLAFRVGMSLNRQATDGGALRLPEGTEAVLIPPQIPIGTGWIELEVRRAGGAPLAHGATIPGERRSAAMEQMQSVAGELTGELVQTLATARALMQAAGTTTVGLNHTLASANSALPVLVTGLQRELAAAEVLTQEMHAQLGRLGPSAATSMDSLTLLLSDSRQLVGQLNVLADTAIPQVAGILSSLDSTTATLEELSRQFSRRPIGVIFRGIRSAPEAAAAAAAAPAAEQAPAAAAPDTVP